MYQWRRFQFFEKDLVKETGEIQNLDIKCVTSGRGHLLLADATGMIVVADRNFQTTSFPAYDLQVTHLVQLRQRNILVSVGDDEDTTKATIKIWNLEKVDPKKSEPLCVKTVKIFSSKFPEVAVTCLAVTEDLTMLAVGLESGAIVLYRGDLMRDRNWKTKVLHPEGENSPITGLGFKEGYGGSRSFTLFSVTANKVAAYALNQRGELGEILDEQGCPQGCSVMNEDGDFVIGRRDAVYFYHPEGKGPASAFEGEKRLLSWFRSYLLIVGRDPHNQKLNSFTIYDLKNHFIAFSGSFSDVAHLVCEWGSIIVITNDNKVYQLQEKDTQRKLEMLFKKNLYTIAISLAQSQQFDYALIIDIFRKYGDHLYAKGDYDGAIGQYLRTIGRLEPSYVIRRFLDAQRIHNLTSYLEALHEGNLANADHTTLLLNCYTKLKDVTKIDQFIKTDAELNFEVETAIRVCRQAGYYEHARYLANRHHEHNWYLKIQLEDVGDCEDALNYIWTLPFYEAEKNIKKYGKQLLSVLPEQTTAHLMALCTSYTPRERPDQSNDVSSHLSDTAPTSAGVTESTASGGIPDIASAAQDSGADLGSGTGSTGASTSKAPVRSPPEEFIHIFVDHPHWLTVFLEYIIQQQPDSSSLVYNTLLELYLREEPAMADPPADVDAEAAEVDRLKTQEARRQKAYELLQHPAANYTIDHALVLVQMHNFKPGILQLFEKLQLYNEIVQFHMEGGEHSKIIRACKKYGEKDPNLWIQVLSYFAGKEDDCGAEIAEVLSIIDRDNLLPPLLVIQILALNEKTTLSVVKEYITGRLQEEQQLIEEDQRLIRTYREETEKMRREIEELHTSAKIFQLSKCSSCTSPLDLPSVHFLCMHSFHQRCLGDSESECPKCALENQKVLDIKRKLEESAGQHDQFFGQLKRAKDGFGTVADYFGRGIFNKVIMLE